MFAVMGIQAAIIDRASSGVGQNVDISMLDCQISMLNYMATMQTMSGIVPEPIGNSHFVHMPYNSFLTKDYPIVIAAVGDQFWPRLLKIFKNPELQDPIYNTAYERQKDKQKLESIIQAELLNKNSDYWLAELEKESVPCARVTILNKQSMMNKCNIEICSLMFLILKEDLQKFQGIQLNFQQLKMKNLLHHPSWRAH